MAVGQESFDAEHVLARGAGATPVRDGRDREANVLDFRLSQGAGQRFEETQDGRLEISPRVCRRQTIDPTREQLEICPRTRPSGERRDGHRSANRHRHVGHFDLRKWLEIIFAL
jgi:hypothetical protein